MVGAPSRPAVAGTWITTFRPSSCRSSSPRSAAQRRTCSITGSSWRDGRAMRVNASKCAQKTWGSSLARTEVSVAMRLRLRRFSQIPRICFFFASNSSSREDALVLQLRELLELGRVVGLGRGRRRRVRAAACCAAICWS